MQLRLSPVIRIAGCAVSMLIFFYSVQRLVALKNKSEGTLIHCLSAFDSQVNNSRLQGKVTDYVAGTASDVVPEGIAKIIGTVIRDYAYML